MDLIALGILQNMLVQGCAADQKSLGFALHFKQGRSSASLTDTQAAWVQDKKKKTFPLFPFRVFVTVKLCSDSLQGVRALECMGHRQGAEVKGLIKDHFFPAAHARLHASTKHAGHVGPRVCAS